MPEGTVVGVVNDIWFLSLAEQLFQGRDGRLA
jgi:hypothetical protein